MKVSPGCISAKNTSALADAPECGCTLANLQPNSLVTRSIASVLGDVDELAAAVIALARQALGVLVGEHRALRFQHRARDDVLRRDQLDLVALAAELLADRLGDLGIGLGERRRKKGCRCGPDLGLRDITLSWRRMRGAERRKRVMDAWMA